LPIALIASTSSPVPWNLSRPSLAALLAEHPHVAAGFPQAWDDMAPERARAAGDQDRRCHVSS
jgi:hypothetical protein